jgi:peptide deformylase
MKSLEIVSHPHPALRWKSREVTRIDAELREMVQQMFGLMYAARGIGLAANQVALPYRLFVMNPTGDSEQPDQEQVFLNPQITRRNGSEEDEEGCLSLPEIYGPVTRATRIVVDAFDLSGRQFQQELEDLPARVVQHEYDHLDGILFTDRVAPSVVPQLQPLIEDLELQFRNRQKEGTIPTDEQLREELRSLERARTT